MKNGVKGIKWAVLYPVIKLREGHCPLLAKKIVFADMLLVIMVLWVFHCSLFAHLLLTGVAHFLWVSHLQPAALWLWCMVLISAALRMGAENG